MNGPSVYDRLQMQPAPGRPGLVLGPRARGALAVALGAGVLPGGPRAPSFVAMAVVRATDGSVTAEPSPGPTMVMFGSPGQLSAQLVALHSVLAQMVAAGPATIDVRAGDARS